MNAGIFGNEIEVSHYDRDPNCPPEDFVEIHVSNPRLYEESTFSKYTVYMVHGIDIEGRFESYRRYSDFLVLRNLLTNRWPGCLIAPLPPKKFIGNFSDAFIESRRKMLSYFLRQLVKHKFLYKSEEFHLFIRGAADFEERSNEIRWSIHDIAYTNERICTYDSDLKVTDKMLFQLIDDEKFLKQSLENLQNLKKNVKSILSEFITFQSLYSNMNERIKDIESRYIGNMRDFRDGMIFPFDKIKLENPYKELFDWIQREILEIKSTLEAISKKNYYENIKLQKEKQFCKIAKVKDKERIDNSNKIVCKNRDLATAISLKKEIEDITKILSIMIIRLCVQELPDFKKNRVSAYEKMIKKFSELALAGFHEIVNFQRNSQILGINE
ncbi:unnamed protein product [Blepharisma stoltei]|uniref:PX domain-containing protein n=1 Tax=Blepharisma stoltei TaxID=1481888 RepID=A0AAU9JI97_9CILI|nr:unnamed protein product [Blepharisma stoltei]